MVLVARPPVRNECLPRAGSQYARRIPWRYDHADVVQVCSTKQAISLSGRELHGGLCPVEQQAGKLRNDAIAVVEAVARVMPEELRNVRKPLRQFLPNLNDARGELVVLRLQPSKELGFRNVGHQSPPHPILLPEKSFRRLPLVE